jgi:hypothetical protein
LGFRRLFPLRDPELKLQRQEERVLLLDLLEEEECLRFLDSELNLAPFLAFVTSVSSVLLHCVLLQVFLDLLR